ncbi:MAG: hypothetical protein MUD12_16250 [Spirochaetes bacterium]|jgi:protein-S-isoprenylcysteine O-methyltransferase Ste14|nr:hypothetical protein [Spirochaetota bacterium]
MVDGIMLYGLLLLGLLIMVFIVRLTKGGINVIASPPINTAAFITAKVLAFTSCLFIPLGAVMPDLKWYAHEGAFSWLPPVFFIPGVFIAVAAMKGLGDDLIFGLPEGDIKKLQTGGIFRISRDPLYLGFILIIIASCVYTPNPFNFAAGLGALTLHHDCSEGRKVFNRLPWK